MKSEIYERVAAIVADILSIELDKITPDARFREDLGADSLDLVELIMAFEDKFGGQISDEDARTIITVGDAVAYLEKK
ncbi:MAG: acyl carrier protein [Chloroflexi bacterium]|nr:MAG: acyl carrier protein [Chloroflexota bacterium]